MEIIHVACNPLTGVWSVIQGLARLQQRTGDTVRLVLPVDHSWPHRTECGSEFDVTIIQTPTAPGTLQMLHHELYRTGGRILESVSDDAVFHVHNAWMSGAFLAGGLPAERSIVTFHGSPQKGFLNGKPIRRFIHRRWGRILRESHCELTSVDGLSVGLAEEAFGIPRSRFTVVGNGLADLKEGVVVRERGDVFVVGFVGALIESKGWRLVLDAVERLTSKGVKMSCVIAGPADARAGGEAAARCARLPHQSRYLGRVVDAGRHVVPELDVLVLPSTHWEGMPMSVIEAFRGGVPVITSRAGGLAEMFTDGEEGVYISQDVSDIERELMRMYSDNGKMQRMRDNARNLFRARYLLDTVLKNYEEVYHRVSRGRSRGTSIRDRE